MGRRSRGSDRGTMIMQHPLWSEDDQEWLDLKATVRAQVDGYVERLLLGEAERVRLWEILGVQR